MWSYLFGRDEDETVDVESEQTLLPPVYDLAKASNLMDECERHVNFQQPDEGNPDWEDHISKYDYKPFKWEEGYYNMKDITRALDLGDCKNGASHNSEPLREEDEEHGACYRHTDSQVSTSFTISLWCATAHLWARVYLLSYCIIQIDVLMLSVCYFLIGFCEIGGFIN